MISLDKISFEQAVSTLCKRDRLLRDAVRHNGIPPMWRRPQGFATLVKIILEQQVSLASGAAVYNKLELQLGSITPEGFLALSDANLKTCGYSRQKTVYCRNLAQAIVDRDLNLRSLVRKDDETARDCLVALKGIGPWTADCYLLMALRRRDIWPVGDLALRAAVRNLHQLDDLPDADAMNKIAGKWRPYRSVAARILWHYYVSA